MNLNRRIFQHLNDEDGLVFLDPFSLKVTGQSNAEDDDESESLLYGFRNTGLILNNTQLMLAVGRASESLSFDDEVKRDKSRRRKSLRHRTTSIRDKDTPMLQ